MAYTADKYMTNVLEKKIIQTKVQNLSKANNKSTLQRFQERGLSY